MTAIVAEARPFLAERGFRKRRFLFNREPEPGLVQVVQFRMAPYEGYGEPHNPFEPHDYGHFSVDFGVWIEEVHRALAGEDRPSFVTEPHCELRLRASDADGRTTWYLGDDDAARSAREVLRNGVLPLLDALASRDALVEAAERDGRVRLTRDRLALAVIHLARGERALAEELVRVHLERGGYHPSHDAWVRETVAPRLGLTL